MAKLGVTITKTTEEREKEQQSSKMLFFMFIFKGNHGFVNVCYVNTVKS